jgi:hypothetical protein
MPSVIFSPTSTTNDLSALVTSFILYQPKVQGNFEDKAMEK